MKKFLSNIMLVALVSFVPVAGARAVELRFTGVNASGAHVRLDSVLVENLTQGWSETLYFPDTVLTLSEAGLQQAFAGEVGLSAYPNPFRSSANVTVSAAESGMAEMFLYNLAGQCVARSNHFLVAGENLFRISVRKAGVCVLVVRAGSGNAVLKLLSRGSCGADAITSCGMLAWTDKRQSAQPFQSGDTMRYTGYSNSGGTRIESCWVVQPQRVSQSVGLVFRAGTQGALKGLFSVSPTKRVRFSQGNLQYCNVGTHAVAEDTIMRGSWRFATNQWDTLGYSNDRADSAYTGWIDLFGWGTSGYDDKYPYMKDPNPTHYGNGINPIAGTNYDWGVYNAISNGGNVPGLWRTLTFDEWRYVLDQRPGAQQKFSYAVIDGIGGVVLLPDYWVLPQGITFVPRSGGANSYSADQWTEMEKAGAVFLPANGFCTGNPVRTFQVNMIGNYWSSTRNVNDPLGPNAAGVSFSHHIISYDTASARYNGQCVRLVQEE